MAQWPKYYISIDERENFLAVAVGERVVVKGTVYTSKLVHIPGHPRESGWSADQPVINQPEISCDIHRSPAEEAQQQYVETKRFTPDPDGKFTFEVDTASYAPGMYYLWVFYSASDGEKPENLMKNTETFYVLGQQEAAALKKIFDDFVQSAQKKPTP